ncbi:MAG: GNAT family N-acetyltransferase [Synechococcales bacterium]|nr:GNAT family N-acetyltransferase [Synechococcales bacterium]
MLPADCVLRQARKPDAWSIRFLVLSAFLDPTQLRWQNFWVIECRGRVVACGQLRSFPDAQELGSLVVARPWRGQGLGTALTQHLIHQATRPLYLECLGDRLAYFYRQFGFQPADWSRMPPSIRRKFRLTYQLATLLPVPLHLLTYATHSTG